MTVAFNDSVLLTNHLRPSSDLPDLSDWETIRTRLQSWHWERKNLAGVVNVLSIALYDLFGADGELTITRFQFQARVGFLARISCLNHRSFLVYFFPLDSLYRPRLGSPKRRLFRLFRIGWESRS